MVIDYELLVIGLMLHVLGWVIIRGAVLDMLEEPVRGECWLVSTLRSNIIIYRLRLDTIKPTVFNAQQRKLLQAKEEFSNALLNFLLAMGFKYYENEYR